MKRLAVLIALTILVAGVVLLGSSDNVISIAHTSIPENEVNSSEANNASATGSIRITMTGALNE